MFDLVDVEIRKPNAARKGVRAVIDKAVLDDDGNVIGFVIHHSSYHKLGGGYFIIGYPQTERGAK